MNICLLNDSFPPVIDGVANVVMNYARILTESPDIKANVIVATPGYPGVQYGGQYPYEVAPYQSLDTSKLLYVNGYRTGNPMDLKTIKRIIEFKPDIIHVHCPASSAILGRILRKETGAPIVFTYHTKFDVDIIRAVGEGFLEHRVVEAMIENIAASDSVWAVSDGAGKSLQALGYKGNYSVITNGVDFPKGKVSEELIRETTEGYDLPEDVPVYLFVGRMMNYKGLPIIIDAMKILSDKGMDYRMVFVGGGGDAEEMQQKVKDLGLESRVIFTGPIHDREKLRAWNSRADLFLFPSAYDTNGIVVREAAACGLASVLIRDSCAAEGITDKRNGFLIDENAASMAELLSELGNDLDRIHEAGRLAMDEIYISWEDNVHEVYKMYEKICSADHDGEVLKTVEDRDAWLKAAEGIVKISSKVFDLTQGVHAKRYGMHSNTVDLLDLVPGYMRRIKAEVKGFGESTRDSIKEIEKSVETGAKQMFGFKEQDPEDAE